jgi:hypothetical protein
VVLAVVGDEGRRRLVLGLDQLLKKLLVVLRPLANGQLRDLERRVVELADRAGDDVGAAAEGLLAAPLLLDDSAVEAAVPGGVVGGWKLGEEFGLRQHRGRQQATAPAQPNNK